MIQTPSNYHKFKDLDGIKTLGQNDIGKDKTEILSLIKEALKDFRQGLSHNKRSYLNKTDELKVNYLNELLKEKISKVDITEQASSYNVEITKTDKKTLEGIVRQQLNGLSEKLIELAVKEIEQVLSSYGKDSDVKSDVENKIEIKDIDNSDFLVEYFDKLYDKSDKFDKLKEGINEELVKYHNDNMRLLKERVQQYKTGLLEYKKSLDRANATIQQQNKRLNELKQKNIGKQEKPKNLVNENLLTQQIVDQVRKNEYLAATPKAKGLSPDHIQSANNLVTKFYENGKIAFQMKGMKNLCKGFGKMLSFVISPIGFAVKKVFGVTKAISKGLVHLGKLVFGATKNIFLAALISPVGATAIGFLAGFVSAYLKDKLIGDEEHEGALFEVFDVMMKYVVNPLINVGEWLFEIGKRVTNLIAKHPVVFASLISMLEGIKFAIQNFSIISKGFGIAKRGLKFAGPFLLGLATSAATEAIFDNSVFKSQSDNKLEYNSKIHKKFNEFKESINVDSVGNLSKQNLEKYEGLVDNMDREYKTLADLQGDLDWIQSNYKSDKDQSRKIQDLLGKDFVEAVFTSDIYGYNKKGHDDFIRNPGKTLEAQITKLTEELIHRNSMLIKQMGIISSASQNGHVDLGMVLEDMVEEKVDDKGNITRRLKHEKVKDENGKETEVNVVADKLRKTGDFKIKDGWFDFTQETTEKDAYKQYYNGDIQRQLAYDAEKAVTDANKAISNGVKIGEVPLLTYDTRQVPVVIHQMDKFETENGLNKEVFQQLVSIDEIKNIMEQERFGNNLQDKLNSYFNDVKTKYVELEQGKNKSLEQQIVDLENDLVGLRKEKEEVDEEIKKYNEMVIR